MTRVLVVNHELDLADQEVESLRRLGYEVLECSGPTHNQCPIFDDRPCDLAERVDVMVYDAWASGDVDSARELILGLRAIHPAVPIVLTVTGMSLDWIDEEPAHGVVPLYGQPTGARLHEAIGVALAAVAERGSAVG